MGCSSSRAAQAHTESEREIAAREVGVVVDEPLLLRLVSACNLPAMDLASESDVYCNARLLASGTSNKAITTAKWPVRWDSSDPLWDSCRLFGQVKPNRTDRLELHFMDCDEAPLDSDDHIGTASCTIGQLAVGERVTLPIRLSAKARKGAAQPSCVVVREPASAVQRSTTVYIVRHGESVWNKAQSEKDFGAMLSDVDHPLNQAGRAQAEALRDAIERATHGDGADAEDAHALRRAELVMASPLTRAVQTCLIGLQPLLLPAEGAPRAVHLNPNLREKRNFGGKDSSGKWCGDSLMRGVHGELAKLYANEPATPAALSTIPLELTHVQNRWWLGSKEGEAHVADRIQELLAQLRFGSASSVVLVGHSHYFREMVRHFRSEACVALDASGGTIDPAHLDARKLSNAGIARCDFDWDGDEAKPLRQLRLLLGTELVP